MIFAPLVCIVVVYAFTKDRVDATQAFLGEFAAAMFVYDFNCNLLCSPSVSLSNTMDIMISGIHTDG